MKKNLKLNDLDVKSFVTRLDTKVVNTAKGGTMQPACVTNTCQASNGWHGCVPIDLSFNLCSVNIGCTHQC